MNLKLIEILRGIGQYSPQYKYARRWLQEEFKPENLEDAVRYAIAHTPFYRDRNYKRFLDGGNFDLSRFPIMRKADILGHEAELLPDSCWKSLSRVVKSGGTTGKSMALHFPFSLNMWRIAYPDMLYEKYAGSVWSKFAAIRGFVPKNGKIFERLSSNRIIFSSYLLNSSTVEEYVKELRQYGVECLLAYPSSMAVFARLVRLRYDGDVLPTLRAIVVSSEICDQDEKLLIKSVFPNAKLVDFYGMAEQVVTAHAVDLEPFEFNRNFGYVEFLDIGEKTRNGNRICEIVGTSVLNATTMPLIRYATDDYAELDVDGNVVGIIGRTSDFVVAKDGDLSPCIVVFSKAPMAKVLQFQYYQDTPGKVEFHIIPKGDDFNEEDRLTLVRDMENSFAGAVDCDVKVVTELEKTRIGKLRRMVQRLDLSKYK